MLRELVIHKKLDQLQQGRANKHVPEIRQLMTVFSRTKPNQPKEPQDEKSNESDDGDEKNSYKFLEGFFIISDMVETNLSHIMDPLQRSNNDSESVNTILRGQITEDQLITILRNCLEAISFMHSANVIHRNICPKHILVEDNFEVRICGLGQIRSLPETNIIKGSGNSRRVREALRS